ncbi:TPA: hypothetical protein ACPSKY_002565 [Legionella bozemanae]
MASYLREDRLKSLKQEKPRAHQFMDSWGRIIKVSEEEHKKFIEEDIAELERGMETRKKESRLIDWTIFIFILGCIFGSSF